MVARQQDITVEQGATFELAVYVKKNGVVLDVTGYTGNMQIRDKPADEVGSIILATGNVSIVDGPGGLVMVTISADTTQGYTWTKGIYDVEIRSGSGIVYRVAKGNAFLDREVSR